MIRREMTAEDAVAIVEDLEQAGLSVWVDGGWGVDALVGRQTRPHRDLDVAVDYQSLDDVRVTLARRGFDHDPSVEPGLPARLVLVDGSGLEVDVHPLRFDRSGHGWQQLSETGRAWGRYPAEELRTTGTIADRTVRCLSPELQLRFHLGYEWDAAAEQDVRLLLEELELGPLPPR